MNMSMTRSMAAGAALVVASLVMTGCSTAVPPGDGSTDTAAVTDTRASTTEAGPTESSQPSTETSTQTPPESTEPGETTDEPIPTVNTYVYYVVDTRSGLRLAREIADVPGSSAGFTAAVQAMIDGAADPDYTTTWNPATTVKSVSVDAPGEVITVDLSGDARTANVGSPGAALMIQQLVWTVTEAARVPDATVTLLIDGQPAGELWGAVDWTEPIGREDAMDVRTLLQLDHPREGAEVTSPVTVDGDAAAFEANVPWRVLDASGAEVQSGATMTTEGMTFAPFSFQVTLQPGEYTIELTEDDPSGGEGGTPYTDTRRITVTA